jgi:hypothetical protein
METMNERIIADCRRKLSPMLESFEPFSVHRDGVRLQARRAGEGPPLLLQGHPQTMAMWHRVAPALAERFTAGRCIDVLALWRERADEVTGASLPCGHYIAEELPEAVVSQALAHFSNGFTHRSCP